MQTRFYLDRTLAHGTPVIIGAGLLLMALFSVIDGLSMRPVIFLLVSGAILLPLWIAFARGTYVELCENKLRVSRMFFLGKYTLLSDAVSIHQRLIYGGVFVEVYMKVLKPDGTFREQGLINKPGLTDSDYKKIFDIIRAANPDVKIDNDILRS